MRHLELIKQNKVVIICTMLAITTMILIGASQKSITEKCDFKTVIVQDGDTLWSMVREAQVVDKYNIRELVDLTRGTNKVGPNIQPGQKIQIPVHK